MGRPHSDDRLVLNGIFWVLCSGAAWHDLAGTFRPWSTVISASVTGATTIRLTKYSSAGTSD
ncbi:transposase [Pseudomonas aeruginosa]|nr:transposase [Pseudomonas aeruginosa]